MCIVSAVSDYWQTSLPQKPYWPAIQPMIQPAVVTVQPFISTAIEPITRAEFDALRRDVEELKKLLLAAKQFDAAVGEPDCELAEKIALIRQVAKLAGVSMDDVFKS